MQARKTQSGYIIRLERDEPVLRTLTDLCRKENIQAGFFLGLGAVKNTELGHYDVAKREYFFKMFREDREVASMTGNVASVGGEPFIHAHAVLSAGDDSLSCIGGHVKECEVAVTLELYLTVFDAPMLRVMDDEVGLKLLQL